MVIAGRNALTHILFIGTGKSEGILGIILLKDNWRVVQRIIIAFI